MEALLEGAFATKRLDFARSGILAQTDYALSLDNARLLFGIAMAAAECLPRGGVVTILDGGAPDAPNLAAMGEGHRAKLKDEVNQALSSAAPDARTAHLSLLNVRAKAMGRAIKAEAECRKRTWQIVAG